MKDRPIDYLPCAVYPDKLRKLVRSTGGLKLPVGVTGNPLLSPTVQCSIWDSFYLLSPLTLHIIPHPCMSVGLLA